MNTSNSKKHNNTNKSAQKSLVEFQENSSAFQLNKIASKQVVTQNHGKKDLDSYIIMYLEDTKLKNLIRQLQEELVKS